MTGEDDHARLVAERIARRVSTGSGNVGSSHRQGGGGDISGELIAMRRSLDSLHQKMVQLESRLTHGEIDSTKYSDGTDGMNGVTWSTGGTAGSRTSPQYFSSTYAPASHPSQERFGVEEATVSELVDFLESDKKCELEPGGKPCDHCSLCSSRGF